MYSYNAVVRYSECEVDGRIKLNYIFNYMQDCSTAQSEDLGVGLSFQEENHYGWFVTEYNLKVLKRPVMGQEIKVSTCPYKLRGMFGYRIFAINDAKTDELLAIADTLWVSMNMDTLSIQNIPKEYHEAYELGEKPDFEFGASKLHKKDLSEYETIGSFDVNAAFIDNNGHMNNSWYPLFAQSALPKDFEYKSVVTNYKKAAYFKDRLEVKRVAIENGYQILLMLGDDVSAIVEFK